MVLSPAAEWRAIEPESGDTGYLFANYVAILAAIPPVCEFLRYGVFGWRGSRMASITSTTTASSPACSAASSTI